MHVDRRKSIAYHGELGEVVGSGRAVAADARYLGKLRAATVRDPDGARGPALAAGDRRDRCARPRRVPHSLLASFGADDIGETFWHSSSSGSSCCATRPPSVLTSAFII